MDDDVLGQAVHQVAALDLSLIHIYLASQKHRLWDGFCMNFLQGLYVALWSLLLFIPGVVKAYSYAMTPYIMAEHPGLTADVYKRQAWCRKRARCRPAP